MKALLVLSLLVLGSSYFTKINPRIAFHVSLNESTEILCVWMGWENLYMLIEYFVLTNPSIINGDATAENMLEQIMNQLDHNPDYITEEVFYPPVSVETVAALNLDNDYLLIFKNHHGYLSQKHEQYIYEYGSLLKPFRNSAAHLLELGVSNGGSLQIWKKYLGETAEITGVDVKSSVCELLQFEEGISTYCFNASDVGAIEEFMDQLPNKHFDIIIDDASHVCPWVVESFESFFIHLKPGGIYVIEDAQTSYFREYSCGYRKPGSTIEYFKNAIDLINYFHIPDHRFKLELSPFQHYLAQYLRSVRFVDSMIIIEKHRQPRKSRYYEVVVGEDAPVFSVVLAHAQKYHMIENTECFREDGRNIVYPC